MIERISVIIVDDHEMLRKGAVSFLEIQPDIEVSAEAGNGKDAISLVEEYVPNVVLMDLVMPGMDGIEATRKIREVSPRTQVIVLTSFNDDKYIFPALKAGAISFLLKDVKAADLINAIRKAAIGEAVLHPHIASRLINQYGNETDQLQKLIMSLTDREMDVLQLIARGLTNQQIGEELVISIGTVKGHVSNILSKLHLADRTQVAVLAWQKGIIKTE